MLAEVVTDAIFEYDAVTRRWHTEAFDQLLGHPVGSEGIDDEWWVEHLHPDQRETVLAERERVLRSDAELWMSEHRICRADGGDADVALRARVLRDDEGRPTRTVVRSVVRDVLESAGYEVIEAANGEDGFRLASDRADVAVVLTDIAMPVMDGLEMVECLRGVGRSVPVVAMTGVADDQRVAALAVSGGAIVLPKPFDRVALLGSVADARRRR